MTSKPKPRRRGKRAKPAAREPATLSAQATQAPALEGVSAASGRWSEWRSRCGTLARFLWRLPWTGIFLRLIGAVVAVWIVVLLTMELWERKTSIEPISVPKSLADAGYTSEVAAHRLRDAMDHYLNEAQRPSASNIMVFGTSGIEVAKITLPAEAPKIVVPTVGISLDTIATSIRPFLGGDRRHSISGEFFIKNKLLWLKLRLDGHELYVSDDGVDPESPDDQFAKAMPTIFDAIQPYVVALAEAGQNPLEALKLADQIIARLPASDDNVVSSYILKGAIHLNLGNHESATTALNTAAQLAPNSAHPHAFLALIASDSGDLDGAIAGYGKAIQRDSKMAVAFNNRGVAFADKGDHDRAIADYTEAIRLDRNFAYAFNNRGVALAGKGDFDRAIRDYDEAVRLDPGYAIAFNNRGVAYKNKGNYDRAIEDYDKSISLQPAYAGAWNNRCFDRAITGQLAAALADCNESLRLKWEAHALDSRGLVYLKMGEFDKAIADYDAAFKSDPKLAGSLYGRGLAKRKKGDDAGADLDIAAAKALRPTIADDFARYGVD